MVRKSRISKTKSSKTPPPKTVLEPDGHGTKERITNESVDILILQSDIEKPSETLLQASDVETGQRSAFSSLHEFWENFRLSPVRAEHIVQINLGWLTLITLGPLFLLIVLRLIALLEYYKFMGKPFVFVPAEVFSDLYDSIYTPLALSLFLSSFIFRYRWYQTLPQTFESLLENEVLRTNEGTKITTPEFLGFLEGYRRNLHSRKRYVLLAISILAILGGALLILATRDILSTEFSRFPPFLKSILILHISTRWVVTQILWSFVFSLWFWSLISTARAIKDLAKRFRIYVQPLHSDRAGGLKKLGDVSSGVGLFIVVAATMSMVVAIRETIQPNRLMFCGIEFQQLLNHQSIMTQDRLTDCIYTLEQQFNGKTRAQISNDLAAQASDDFGLRNYAIRYYRLYQQWFQPSWIFKTYAMIYVMDFVLLVALILSLYVIVWPILDIHYRMAEFKHKRERETNRHISVLFNELTLLIKQDEFEKADKIKTKISFLTNELTSIEKYPTWPIRPLLVARSYLTSSFITALIGYIFTLLQPALSAAASGLFQSIAPP